MDIFKNAKLKGFTLIELLMYLGITASILLVISIFFVLMLQIISPAIGSSANTATFVVPTGALSPTVFDLSSGTIRIKEGTGSTIDLTNSKVTASSLNFQNLSWSSTSGVIRISFTLTRNNPGNRTEYDYSQTFYATATLRP